MAGKTRGGPGLQHHRLVPQAGEITGQALRRQAGQTGQDGRATLLNACQRVNEIRLLFFINALTPVFKSARARRPPGRGPYSAASDSPMKPPDCRFQ
jgi:hypothetical protein